MMWIVRAARWVRHPPSEGRVLLVLVVAAAALAIAGAEWAGWWPDWATMDRPGRHLPRP